MALPALSLQAWHEPAEHSDSHIQGTATGTPAPPAASLGADGGFSLGLGLHPLQTLVILSELPGKRGQGCPGGTKCQGLWRLLLRADALAEFRARMMQYFFSQCLLHPVGSSRDVGKEQVGDSDGQR